jgi:hypothetical protein
VTLEHFLRAIVGALAAEGIPSMLTGSVAAAYHGATRATMDVDLVIEPTALDLERFVRRTHALGTMPHAAHGRWRWALFNVIDPTLAGRPT